MAMLHSKHRSPEAASRRSRTERERSNGVMHYFSNSTRYAHLSCMAEHNQISRCGGVKAEQLCKFESLFRRFVQRMTSLNIMDTSTLVQLIFQSGAPQCWRSRRKSSGKSVFEKQQGRREWPKSSTPPSISLKNSGVNPGVLSTKFAMPSPTGVVGLLVVLFATSCRSLPRRKKTDRFLVSLFFCVFVGASSLYA